MSLSLISLAPREAVSLLGTDAKPAGPITASIEVKTSTLIQITLGEDPQYFPITLTADSPNYQFQPQFVKSGTVKIYNTSPTTTVFLAVQGKVQAHGSTDSNPAKRKQPSAVAEGEIDDSITSADKRTKLSAKTSTPKAVTPAVAEVKAAGPEKEKEVKKDTAPKPQTVMKLPNGLQYFDQESGRGPAVTKGSTIGIRYQGLFTNGQIFDSNMPKGQLLTFAVGRGEVVSGMDQGVLGMQIGGKRRLVIPSQLGYGKAGAPPSIPPNSTLIFDVELVKLAK